MQYLLKRGADIGIRLVQEVFQIIILTTGSLDKLEGNLYQMQSGDQIHPPLGFFFINMLVQEFTKIRKKKARLLLAMYISGVYENCPMSQKF